MFDFKLIVIYNIFISKYSILLIKDELKLNLTD